MTLNDLLADLAEGDPEAPLIFEAPTGRTGPGYHVTEFKRADIASIDCGGQRNSWREVALQIQDGRGSKYMSVGKFLSIAQRSIEAIEGAGDSPLRVEFAAGNDRLEVLSVQSPKAEPYGVVVPLGAEAAVCKPLLRAAAALNSTSCCGTARVTVCC